jgi:DNA-binding PadR family transcriptional regulator
MSTRYAVLGLLAEGPLHGYGLKSAFDARVSPLWGLTTGQIYQSLNALERAGLLTSRSERAGRRPLRRVYALTDAGRRELDRWLRTAPSRWRRPLREEVLIRLMLLRDSEASMLAESLARQEREASAMLTRVTRMREQAQARGAPEVVDLPALFLDALAHHLEADVKSLERFHAAVAARAMPRGTAARDRGRRDAHRGRPPSRPPPRGARS